MHKFSANVEIKFKSNIFDWRFCYSLVKKNFFFLGKILATQTSNLAICLGIYVNIYCLSTRIATAVDYNNCFVLANAFLYYTCWAVDLIFLHIQKKWRENVFHLCKILQPQTSNLAICIGIYVSICYMLRWITRVIEYSGGFILAKFLPVLHLLGSWLYSLTYTKK